MSFILLMGILQTYNFSNVGNASESGLVDRKEDLIVIDPTLKPGALFGSLLNSS
jgi:hypothetical protein